MKVFKSILFLSIILGGLYFFGFFSPNSPVMTFAKSFVEPTPQERMVDYRYRVVKSETSIPMLTLIDGTKPCEDDDYLTFEENGDVLLHRGDLECERNETSSEAIYEWTLSPDAQELTLSNQDGRQTFQVQELSEKQLHITMAGEAMLGLIDTQTTMVLENLGRR